MYHNNSTTENGQPLPTLLTVFDHDLQQLQLRVGIDRTQSTLVRQQQLRAYVSDFLAEKHQVTDIPLAQLSAGFIYDFASWLSTSRRYRGGTVWLACQQLKSVVSRAYQRGLVSSNPFYAFHIGRNIRPRQFLTAGEVRQLIDHPLDDPQQAFYRDLFVFSALTGMAFADICHLRPADIRLIDGQRWIVAQRQKTHTPFQVMLLPQAAAIADRYSQGGGTVFGPVVYRTLAKHIPAIISACGIQKHVTFHCARHTFAVMALDAGMPIESISRILGHTNITTTQIYAKITLSKLGQDMEQMIKNLKKTGIID